VHFAVIAVSGLLFGGCSTQADPTANGAKAADDEYVMVQSTGSLIPRRVKKSQPNADGVRIENGNSPTLKDIEQIYLRALKSASEPPR
jgi:hypothetical protein